MNGRPASSAWVRFFCSQDRRARTAVFTRAGSEWQLSSVGADSPRASQPGSLPVAGRFGISPGYSGCPRCGNNSYVRCGNCGELSCWNSSSPRFSCGNCANRGEVSGSIESLNATDTG